MTILIGYVPSPLGDAAVAAGIEEATLRDEDLLIVNSARQGVTIERHVASDDDYRRVKGIVDAAGVQAEYLRITHEDDLAEAILELARERDVTMIVIGVRNRTPVGKFIMGSLSQQILLQSDRPVLAAKMAA
jgi:nucleotide-binding universal stress UspA family protein